jgi:hypothetical protein
MPKYFKLDQIPRIVDVSQGGNRATVLTKLTTFKLAPNNRIDRQEEPRGFELVRERGGWKLVDNLYLGTLARNAEARLLVESGFYGGKKKRAPPSP